MKELILTFYGDDFTGSTDTMEQLEMGGLPAVLFLDIPTPTQLAKFPDVKAVGIAGVSRSMSPEQMDEELPPKFHALNALDAPFFHYKVCSTFDSSPTIGSIGHATEIGWRIFEPSFVPLMIGAPFLRRYVAFGNLFARVGDITYRLDRHPTMSKHPVTPMDESDLRLHLGKQTQRQIGLVDIWHMISKSESELDSYVQSVLAGGDEIIVFDTLDEQHLQIVGRILWNEKGEKPVFIVGSSGVEAALTLHLQKIGEANKASSLPAPGAVDQLLVMSGSAASGTSEQIQWALENGFVGIRLDGAILIDSETAIMESARTIEQALSVISGGQSVILFSALGPDDPALNATRARAERLGLDRYEIGQRLGKQQGRILNEILEKSGLRRVCVAGGDTSGHSALQLGIFALRMIQPIDPGAPLCRASSENPLFDNLEISLKGGQNGVVDYFGSIRHGTKMAN